MIRSFSYRIFGGIFGQLVARGRFEVDSGVVGNQQQVQKDISAFIAQCLMRGRVVGQCGHFCIALPLRQFEQFCGFQIERDDQVAQCVKLRPVPLVTKIQQGLGQCFHLSCFERKTRQRVGGQNHPCSMGARQQFPVITI